MSRDYFEEGHKFEAYVAGKLFPRPEFSIAYITTRRDDLEGRFIESAHNPDIQIHHMKSNHYFWVECKWRTYKSVRNGKLMILTRDQLTRYSRFEQREGVHRVYVVVGLVGRPDSPGRVFCVPLNGFQNHPWLFLKKLCRFERPPTRPFRYQGGWLV